MKCPILTATIERLTGMTEYPPLDCLKEGCAIYDDKNRQCSKVTATEQFLRIANALNAIAAKMPKDLAPRG